MTNDKSILIKNIYYMLTYAFNILKETQYKKVAGEEFDEIYDFFAAIINKGVSQLIKQGLYREYLEKSDNLNTLKGKIDINNTIINRINNKQLLGCEFDELSENNKYNQIIKTTINALLNSAAVSINNKKDLKKLLVYFVYVDDISPSSIHWSTLRFQRNNRTYHMILNLCYFVLSGLLLSNDNGRYITPSFSDEQMSSLYERFVREYYKKHFPMLKPAANKIEWNTESGLGIELLPEMKTDITLKFGNKILIIDTKYYGSILKSHYDKESISSGNIYQIYTYVKNRDKSHTGNVSGMLLYAKTQEEISPDIDVLMDGNLISVKTLDLNKDFILLSAQLDRIVKDYFHVDKVNDF